MINCLLACFIKKNQNSLSSSEMPYQYPHLPILRGEIKQFYEKHFKAVREGLHISLQQSSLTSSTYTSQAGVSPYLAFYIPFCKIQF